MRMRTSSSRTTRTSDGCAGSIAEPRSGDASVGARRAGWKVVGEVRGKSKRASGMRLHAVSCSPVD